MRRLLAVLLLTASAALGAWIWSVLDMPTTLAESAPTDAARPLPSATVAAVRDESQRRREQVATTLARPLFSPTRRPKPDDAAPAQAAAPITALPRMTAIMINGKLRSAIFDGNGKPTVLGEGGHLGPFTVQSIEPQQVTIIGPEGKRVLRTTFSNDPPPAMPLPQNPALTQAFAPPLPIPVILPPGMPIPPGLPMGTSR